jgi:hypothetical protein
MAGSGLRWSLALAITAALTVPAGAGLVRQCVKASAVEYRECKGDCKDEYKTAKDACINKDHVCVDACREERAECREATGFDAAIDACNDAKEVAIANCKVLYAAGTDERDQCIDNAQLDAFQCRDQVREDIKPELKACRAAFRTCVGICPPGAGPVEDPSTCRSEAKADYKLCKGDCREDFQIAKDACRNRDHDCVEECRTDRQACKAPILATLDAALAACKAAKQTAVALCNGDDACIDQAQAVAFVCRDDAHEAARPGLKACREGFKACVQLCPAASPSGAFLD